MHSLHLRIYSMLLICSHLKTVQHGTEKHHKTNDYLEKQCADKRLWLGDWRTGKHVTCSQRQRNVFYHARKEFELVNVAHKIFVTVHLTKCNKYILKINTATSCQTHVHCMSPLIPYIHIKPQKKMKPLRFHTNWWHVHMTQKNQHRVKIFFAFDIWNAKFVLSLMHLQPLNNLGLINASDKSENTGCAILHYFPYVICEIW